MKVSRYLLVIVAMCLLPSLMFAAAGDAAKGKDVYMAKCKNCHGADGTPSDGMTKSMGVKAMKEYQSVSDADMKKAVTDGFNKMKPVAGVAGADLDNVIAFCRTLK
jgi:cytochrome c5